MVRVRLMCEVLLEADVVAGREKRVVFKLVGLRVVQQGRVEGLDIHGDAGGARCYSMHIRMRRSRDEVAW